MHSGHEVATDGEWTGDMAPEHDIGLEVDADADDHRDSGESNSFKVLMVVVNKERSGKQVRFGSFCTAVDAVAFLFDSRPASSRFGELSATIHDRLNDVIFLVELVQDISPAGGRGIGFEDEEFAGIRIMQCTTVEDSLLQVVKCSNLGRIPASLPVIVHSSHAVKSLYADGVVGDELAAYYCCTK